MKYFNLTLVIKRWWSSSSTSEIWIRQCLQLSFLLFNHIFALEKVINPIWANSLCTMMLEALCLIVIGKRKSSHLILFCYYQFWKQLVHFISCVYESTAGPLELIYVYGSYHIQKFQFVGPFALAIRKFNYIYTIFFVIFVPNVQPTNAWKRDVAMHVALLLGLALRCSTAPWFFIIFETCLTNWEGGSITLAIPENKWNRVEHHEWWLVSKFYKDCIFFCCQTPISDFLCHI